VELTATQHGIKPDVGVAFAFINGFKAQAAGKEMAEGALGRVFQLGGRYRLLARTGIENFAGFRDKSVVLTKGR
jgi:hypothetical protein